MLYAKIIYEQQEQRGKERVVIYKHALRNALIPVITVVGLQFGALLGGTVLVESVLL